MLYVLSLAPRPQKYLLGGAAILIDVGQGDNIGVGLGAASMAYSPAAVADIAYGVNQVIK